MRNRIFKIDQKFLSSNFSRCEILDENAIRLYLSPEDKFVNNPSPWFAFRKSAHQEEIYVELFYEKFEHRYHPKVSYDLINWKKIDRDMIKIQNNGKKLLLLSRLIIRNPLFLPKRYYHLFGMKTGMTI